MQAFIIKPTEKTIESIELQSREQINELIGFDTVIADDLGDGEQLFFDEECFLRGTSGRFQIDKLIPVSGIGIIVGSDADGSLQDTRLSQDELSARLKFIE